MVRFEPTHEERLNLRRYVRGSSLSKNQLITTFEEFSHATWTVQSSSMEAPQFPICVEELMWSVEDLTFGDDIESFRTYVSLDDLIGLLEHRNHKKLVLKDF